MKIGFRYIAGMFLLLLLFTMWILSPFSQAVIPVGVSQTQYYRGRGIGPVIEIPHPHIGVEVSAAPGSPALYYSNVIFVGNLILNLVVLSFSVLFWRKKR